MQGSENFKNWIEYFELIVVSARKPGFFQEDCTALREVDQVRPIAKGLGIPTERRTRILLWIRVSFHLFVLSTLDP